MRTESGSARSRRAVDVRATAPPHSHTADAPPRHSDRELRVQSVTRVLESLRAQRKSVWLHVAVIAGMDLHLLYTC